MAEHTWITECADPVRWRARILRSVVVNEDSRCWVWSKGIDRHGYGRFSAHVDGRRRSFSAHRAAYLALVGPIPYPLMPDHLCRNRACVNPDHMELVANSENVRRGSHAGKKGRSGHQGGITGCSTHGMMNGYEHAQPNGRMRWVCRSCAVTRLARWKANRAA